jgi:hypothetical protein
MLISKQPSTRARKVGALAQFDEFIELADKANERNCQAIKTRLWARTWVLAHLDPSKYGERIVKEHSGEVTVKRVISDL